jgi:hypothetical protein
VRPVDVLSDEGAEAFARYFMQTVDWAYASMDSSLMRAEYDPATCAYCNQAANRTDADRAAGKRYDGGRSTIFYLMSAAGADVTNNLVLVVLNVGPLSVYDSMGQLVDTADAASLLQFNVRAHYSDSRWHVAEVKLAVASK